MKLKFIEIETISKQVRKIYLNRPEKRNALCNPLRQELFDSLEELDKVAREFYQKNINIRYMK